MIRQYPRQERLITLSYEQAWLSEALRAVDGLQFTSSVFVTHDTRQFTATKQEPQR